MCVLNTIDAQAKDLDAKHNLAKELEQVLSDNAAKEQSITVQLPKTTLATGYSPRSCISQDLEKQVQVLQSTKDFNDRKYRKKLKIALMELQRAKSTMEVMAKSEKVCSAFSCAAPKASQFHYRKRWRRYRCMRLDKLTRI